MPHNYAARQRDKTAQHAARMESNLAACRAARRSAVRRGAQCSQIVMLRMLRSMSRCRVA